MRFGMRSVQVWNEVGAGMEYLICETGTIKKIHVQNEFAFVLVIEHNKYVLSKCRTFSQIVNRTARGSCEHSVRRYI